MTPEQVRRLFRELFLADVEGAEPRSVEAYLELFPGHEDLVRAQHERLLEDEARTSSFDALEVRASTSSSLGPGDRLGRYLIDRELGRGGQAVVHRARDEELQRPVALKVLTRLGPGSEGALQRFRREAEVCSRLQHPSVCTVYEAGVRNGVPFIAMQLVEGETLSDRIGRRRLGEDGCEVSFEDEGAMDADAAGRGELPGREALAELALTFERAARALGVAHRAGVIHRDIKPGNLMIQPDGTPVLLDFGLARIEEDAQLSLTRTGDFFGTPAYMSPEQISAHRITVDERSDLFSLGVTLYEAMTLQRPFDAATREGIYQAILMKDPRDPRRLNPAISRDLAAVVTKLLEKDRDRRYQSADELADDLERIRRIQPIHARHVGPLVRSGRWLRRNRAVATLGLLLLLVAGAGVAVTRAASERSARDERRRAVEAEELRQRAERDRALEEAGDYLAAFDLARLDPFSQLELTRVGNQLLALGDEGRAWLLDRVVSGAPKERVGAALMFSLAPSSPEVRRLVALAGDPEESAGLRLIASRVLMTAETAAFDEDVRAMLPALDASEAETDEGVAINLRFGLARRGDASAAGALCDILADDDADQHLKLAIVGGAVFSHGAAMRPVVETALAASAAGDATYDLVMPQMVQWLEVEAAPRDRAHARALLERDELDESLRARLRALLEAGEDEPGRTGTRPPP